MKNKILLICVTLTLVIGVIVGGCAAPAPAPTPTPAPTPAPAPVEKIELRFSTQWPEPSTIFQTDFKPVLDEIKEKSKGRITFTVFAGGALGPPGEQYDMVVTGKADMGTTSHGYYPGRFPLSDIVTLPGAYETSEAGQKAVQAIADRALQQEYADTRLLALFQSQTFYLYTSKKEIRTMEDLKGLKIRSAGGINTPSLTALGATPVTMPIPDVYQALQTGVVDGSIFGPSAGPSLKAHEVLKHVLKYPMGFMTNMVVMNLNTWKKIPDDLKPIVTQAASKAGFGEVKTFFDDDPVMTKALLDRGGTTYVLPKEEAARWTGAFKLVVDKWAADNEAKGLPVKKLMDIAREECKKYNVPFPY